MTLSTERTVVRSVLALTVLAGLAAMAVPARATTITVTSNLDSATGDGLCSLREAVIAANTDTAVDACPAGSGSDTITLPPGVYPLTIAGRGEQLAATGDLDIDTGLTLVGAGSETTLIDGSGLDRVLELHAGAVVQVNGVAITNGDADVEDGGGIYVNGGQLNLTHSVIRDNNGRYGGGLRVENDGSATVIDSRLTNNTGLTGGGMYVGSYTGSTTVVVINSLIDANAASGSLTGSHGGGARSASNGDITFVNTTISGNSATLSGGGIFADHVVHLHNATVTANTADSDGDGTGNGGGVTISAGVPVGFGTARNSLIAANTDASPTGAQYANCAGTLTGEGYILLGNITGCTLAGVTTGNVLGATPFLGPLQDNGGPTPTHALLAFSGAIDAGDPAGCLDQALLPLARDQRGYVRPVDGGTTRGVRCDIGAFEYGSHAAPTPTATTTSSQTPTPSPTATVAVGTTATLTQVVTTSPTPSRTATVTATSAVSATPTRSATAGPSPTPTRTPTRTATRTATLTATALGGSATPPPSSTAAPSNPTAAPTQTSTNMPTGGPSPIPADCSGFCLALPELHRP